MDLPYSDIAIAGVRGMLTLYAVGAMVQRVIPDAPNICDKIELAKKVLSFIGEAPEWVNYDKNLEDNIESLKTTMKDLLSVEEDVSQEVEILEFQNNKKRKREVEVWQENVKRKSEEVAQVESEMGQTGAFSRFLFRAWLGSCVEKKRKEISILLDQKRAFEQQLVINAERAGRERLVPSELVGQFSAQIKEDIWRHLTNREVTIIGVEGEEGMGKSTIIMHIYNQILDKPSLFEHAFYVDIKKKNSVYELQTAIGRELKLEDLENEDGEIRRAARIYRALKLAKRFVLILDDIASAFELDKVGIPLEKDGGKLVVVTELRRVCQRMLCRQVVSVNELPFEDARKLFMKTLNPSSDLSSEIEDIADKIIQRCNGIPRRIIVASTSLRSEDELSTWSSKLSELENND